MCQPDVSPGTSLACRMHLHTDVDNCVCVHFLFDFSFFLFFKLVIYLFPAVPCPCFVRGLPAGAAAGCPLARCTGSGPWWLARLPLRPAARRLFPGQGSNPRPPRQQEDPSPPATTEALMFFSLVALFIVVNHAGRRIHRPGPSQRAPRRRPMRRCVRISSVLVASRGFSLPSCGCVPALLSFQHFLFDGFQFGVFFFFPLQKAPLCPGNDFREISRFVAGLSGRTWGCPSAPGGPGQPVGGARTLSRALADTALCCLAALDASSGRSWSWGGGGFPLVCWSTAR